MADWIVLGCAAGAAALAIYLFFGAYHYRWRQSVREDEDYQDDIDYVVKAFTPQPGCTCKCCMWDRRND